MEASIVVEVFSGVLWRCSRESVSLPEMILLPSVICVKCKKTSVLYSRHRCVVWELHRASC